MERILFMLAVLPTIILGTFIYKNDKLEKEPASLLLSLGAAGIGSAILTLVLTYILGAIIPFFASEYYTSFSALELAIYVFVGVALIEEFSKWIFTYIIAWKNKEFNHVYDAIVYCVFVSLGFATIENILYVFGSESVGSAFFTAFNRMIFSVPGHAFFGVLMGYYLGLAKLTNFNGKKEKSIKYLLLSVLVPTICHFLFDYLLMINLEYSFLLFVIFVVIMFSIAISKVKRLSNIPTNIFNKPQRMDYIYNAFGNNNYNQNNNYTYNNYNYQNNNQVYSQRRICKNCGKEVTGKFCSNCGKEYN